MQYFAPAMTENICKGGPAKCVSDLGQYPYDSYERGPNGESILRIGYPKGGWSPGGRKSGGILFFAYPYKVGFEARAMVHIASTHSLTLAHSCSALSYSATR